MKNIQIIVKSATSHDQQQSKITISTILTYLQQNLYTLFCLFVFGCAMQLVGS